MEDLLFIADEYSNTHARQKETVENEESSPVGPEQLTSKRFNVIC